MPSLTVRPAYTAFMHSSRCPYRAHTIRIDVLVSSRSGFSHNVLSETIRAKLTEWPAVGRVWIAHRREAKAASTTDVSDDILGIALAIEPGGENAVASVPLHSGAAPLYLIRTGRRYRQISRLISSIGSGRR